MCNKQIPTQSFYLKWIIHFGKCSRCFGTFRDYLWIKFLFPFFQTISLTSVCTTAMCGAYWWCREAAMWDHRRHKATRRQLPLDCVYVWIVLSHLRFLWAIQHHLVPCTEQLDHRVSTWIFLMSLSKEPNNNKEMKRKNKNLTKKANQLKIIWEIKLRKLAKFVAR